MQSRALVYFAVLAASTPAFAAKFNHGGNWGECEQGQTAINAIRTRIDKCLAETPESEDSNLCQTDEFKKRCGGKVTIKVSDSYIAAMLCHNLSPVTTLIGFVSPFSDMCMNKPETKANIAKKVKHVVVEWNYPAFQKFNPHGDATKVGEMKYDAKTGTVTYIAGSFANVDEQGREFIEKNF